MAKKTPVSPVVIQPLPSPVVSGGWLHRPWLPQLALVLATVAVYAASIGNDLVFFDDDKAILYNHALKNPSLSKFFTGQNLGMYAPITWIGYWVGSLLSGQEAWGYHLLGMLLHALNATLVFGILRQLLGSERVWLAFFAAVLFAAHPIQVEAVSWAAALSTVLFAAFYLGSWRAYLRYADGSGGGVWLAISLILFVLGCLSKSAAVTLPLVLLATDWLFFPKKINTLWRTKLPYVAVAIGFGLYTFATREAEGHDIEATSRVFGFADRFWMISQTLLFYPFKILVPLGFSISYPFVKSPQGTWPLAYYLAPFALATVAGLVWWKARHRRDVLFALAVYLLPLTVMLPFRTVGTFELRSDRYAYVSCVGVFLLLGMLVERLPRAARWPALSGLVAICGLLAWQQTTVWRDGVALFRNCTAKTPESSLCQCNLAYNQLITNRFDEAIRHYSEALKYDPNTVEAYNGRGQAYLFTNKFADALADFDKAIAAGIVTPKLFLNKGKCLVMTGRETEAIAPLSRSLELEPKNPEAYFFRAIAHEKSGDPARVAADYAAAIAQNPNYLEARINRGSFFFQQGKMQEAIEDYTAALAQQPPQTPMLLNNRANAYFKLGQLDQALADADAALAANPNYTKARDTKAMILTAKR
jgi:protein O-mannosyl-transferase